MTSDEGVEFYWCVNCGYSGKFPYRRVIKHYCEKCNYDSITPYELEEINEDEHLKERFKDHLK